MSRGIHRLSFAKIKSLTKPNFYSDGGGLYLQVSIFGASKSWVLKFSLHGKRRSMGLGAFPLVSLADAREKAAELRKLVRDGIDPLEAKEAARAARKAQDAAQESRLTFDQCTRAVIAQKAKELSNTKALDQWSSTLETYAYPVLNDGRKVDELTKHDISKVLRPIWHEKLETASRLRGRIEAIFNYAKANDAFKGDNPAEWKGCLEPLLGKQNKAKKDNHPALHYKQVGAFIADLRLREGMAALALEFAILTAARSGEARGAKWSEIDLQERLWIIPAERMKAGKEHYVPLADEALAVLKAVPRIVGSDFVFPNASGSDLSDMTLAAVIKRMNGKPAHTWLDPKGRAIVVHGFRSTFKDWAAETTNHQREVIEHALAHQLKDKVEAAYQRGSLLDKRRALMQDWSAYCGQVLAPNVVSMVS